MNDLTEQAHAVRQLGSEIGATLIGHAVLVERLLIALLAGGHVLIEGPPGIAKTRAVKALAAHLPGSHARIVGPPGARNAASAIGHEGRHADADHDAAG